MPTVFGPRLLFLPLEGLKRRDVTNSFLDLRDRLLSLFLLSAPALFFFFFWAVADHTPSVPLVLALFRPTADRPL